MINKRAATRVELTPKIQNGGQPFRSLKNAAGFLLFTSANAKILDER